MGLSLTETPLGRELFDQASVSLGAGAGQLPPGFDKL
jgi:hypothetical protein